MVDAHDNAPYRGDDIYCDRILSGILPVRVVVETDTVLAFHHTRPYWSTHIVVIPMRHVPSLLELDADDPLLRNLWAIVQQVSAQVLAQDGEVAVQTHLGAWQDSKHLHVHVRSGEALHSE